MRVLVVSHTYISTINRDKWKRLVDLYDDITVDVIFPNRWPTCLFNHKVEQGVVHRHGRCRFRALDAVAAGNEVRYRYLWKELYLLLKELRPDIIHVEQGVCALSYTQLYVCARLLGIKPKFIFFTWVNWKQKSRLSDYLIWRWVERFNCAFSHGAITGNQEAKKIINKHLGRKPIIVLPQLGVSQKIFSPARKTSFLRKKRIMYLGRFVAEKGIFLLFNAFKSLREKIDGWELVFIGRGPVEEQLKEEIIKNNMQKDVFIKQPVIHEKLGDLYQLSDIVVLPSCDTLLWREQFGHVLIEAMACRVAVVGSSAGEIPHVIADAGVVFRQSDELHLANCLYLLMSDDALRSEYAKKGYERVMKLYTHEAIAHKTYSFWSQLLGEM